MSENRKNHFTDNKCFLFYKDWAQYFELLDDKKLGAVLRAVVKYSVTGEETKLDNGSMFLFLTIKNSIDRDGEKWEKMCEKNAKNVAKRWNKNTTVCDPVRASSKNTDTNTNTNTNTNTKTKTKTDIDTNTDTEAHAADTPAAESRFKEREHVFIEGTNIPIPKEYLDSIGY